GFGVTGVKRLSGVRRYRWYGWRPLYSLSSPPAPRGHADTPSRAAPRLGRSLALPETKDHWYGACCCNPGRDRLTRKEFYGCVFARSKDLDAMGKISSKSRDDSIRAKIEDLRAFAGMNIGSFMVTSHPDQSKAIARRPSAILGRRQELNLQL